MVVFVGKLSLKNPFFRGFVQGNSLGSCFSRSFGGACSGTPERCDDCLGVCESRDNVPEFEIPAKEL